jgi:putative membrane protein
MNLVAVWHRMEQFFLSDSQIKNQKTMKRIFKILTLASLVAALSSSCNESRREQEQDSNEVAEERNDEKFEDNDMEKDADFVAEAVAANLAEIQMTKLAAQRSSNAEVKRLAKTLEADHTKVLAELKALAQQKAITIPVEPMDEAKRKMDNLREEDAKDFDKKWLEAMEDAHDKSINKFERRADKGEDADIKAFASKTVPHLKMHKEQIDQAQDHLKDAKDKNM